MSDSSGTYDRDTDEGREDIRRAVAEGIAAEKAREEAEQRRHGGGRR